MPTTAHQPTDARSLVGRIRAALTAEHPVRGLGHRIELAYDGATLRMSGELPSIEAKRRAVGIVNPRLPASVVLCDQLRVLPFVRMNDEEIRRAVRYHLADDEELQRCAITSSLNGHTQLWLRPNATAEGTIDVSVRHGAIHLEGVVPSHLHWRLAEARAWGCLGAHAVHNALEVVPDQMDGNAVLERAVRHVLATEPLLDQCSIDVVVQAGRTLLTGTATDGAMREVAEYSTWFVPGVEAVVSQLVVEQGPQLR